MDSQEIANYISHTDSIHKPWLLVQLRLAKLQEEKEQLTKEEYSDRLADIHRDLMNLGTWWIGQEDEVF